MARDTHKLAHASCPLGDPGPQAAVAVPEALGVALPPGTPLPPTPPAPAAETVGLGVRAGLRAGWFYDWSVDY
jgi:hypothetical protein